MLWLQVHAYPSLYTGCNIPPQGYARHGGPEVDESISFVLKAADDTPVAIIKAGEAYTLTVSTAEPTRSWIHATVGHIEALGTGIEPRACNQAWGAAQEAVEHTVLWTAPALELGDLCSVFSTATATGSRAPFLTNSVRTSPFMQCIEFIHLVISLALLQASALRAETRGGSNL